MSVCLPAASQLLQTPTERLQPGADDSGPLLAAAVGIESDSSVKVYKFYVISRK